MPDKIKRKALEEQERKRQPEKLAELAKAFKTQIPERKIEWVDPPLHDPNRKPEMIPLPNYTGVKAKMVPLPDDPNEPIRMQKMPYLIDTKPKEDAQTGGMTKKLFPVSRYEAMEQKAREYAEPALFDAVSPFGKGLAKIIAIYGQKPDEAGQLFKFMQTSEKDPESPYYRPYARPTNKGAMDELLKLGIDTSNLDEKWFNDNAWLKKYARLGSTGMPKVPTSNTSREETAAYYYVKLADSEGRTRKAETELSGLRREIGYWAGRQDRNYSDEEIISRIDWNKYPTLTMLREGQQKGRPVPLNRAVDFDSDTVFGMLWSARNGKTSGSSTIDAARYVLGEGKQFAPDEFVRAKRDLQSFAYNPYALGSTVDEAAEYFKVDSFDQKWLNDNKGILKSGNEMAMRAYSQVYGAEQVTKAAEDENQKLSERIDARLNRAVSAGGNINANALLKDALFGLDTLQSMDEGLFSGDLAKLTRPVNYRWQDVASNVSGQVQVINARQNAPHNPAELDIAARSEEEKVIQGQGTLIQKDAVPKSYTSFQEKVPGLWAAGLTKNPLSAGWYAPAGGEQSSFGPDQVKTQSIADARKAGDFLGAAAQGYDALTGSGGDLSKLSTNEGAVRMAIDLALDSAKAFSVEQTAIPVLRAAAARFDDAVNSILGIDPDAAKQILPQVLFTTTVQGDIKNQASGTVGLVSAILRLGESALKTVTDHVLGEKPTLQTAQTMFHILKLRDMEKGTQSEAFQEAEAALRKAAGDTLQSAAAQTGHEELDDLTSITNQSSHNLDAVLNRWGFQGVNYIGNLLKAGRGDLAAAITAMPTYAKSAIVAETNMRTFGLNDAAIAAQENALAVDMKSPIVVLSAKQIAKQQAVEARKAELTAGGGLLVQSILVQKVNEAGKTVNQSKLALNQALRNEHAGGDALTKAQALFHKNMADTAAADTVVAAIDNLQKATDVRVKAQKELKSGQLTLHNAQQKLADTQKQATARVDEQAKQDVDDMRLKLQEARTKLVGKALSGEQGELLLWGTQTENYSNKLDLLANVNDSRQSMGKTKEMTTFYDKNYVTDHFNSLSPKDQKTWLDLIEKYRAGLITEDELKTLNDLKPESMLDFPMPEKKGPFFFHGDDDGSGKNDAQAGEQPDKDNSGIQGKAAVDALYGIGPNGNSVAYMNQQEQYNAKIQAATTVPEIDALIEELQNADPFLVKWMNGNKWAMPRLMEPSHHWSSDLLSSAKEKKSQIMEANRKLYDNPYVELDENAITGMDDLLSRRDDAVERLYSVYKEQFDPSVPEVNIRDVFTQKIEPLLMAGDLDALDQILGPQYKGFKDEARSTLEGLYQGMDSNWFQHDILANALDKERQSKRLGFEKTKSEKIMDELLEYKCSGGVKIPSFMSTSGIDSDAAGIENQTPEQMVGILLQNISDEMQQKVSGLIATEPPPGTKEHEEWKYQLDVAKYELGQAQAQILMNQNGFWEKSAEGARLKGNPVEDGAWLVETLRKYNVDEKTIEYLRCFGLPHDDYLRAKNSKSYIEAERETKYFNALIRAGVPLDIIQNIPTIGGMMTLNEYSPFALSHVMTPSEKGVWNWYLANNDQKGANAFFELIRESLYKRDAEVRQVAREGVNSKLGTLESIPGKPIASLKATLGTFINWMQGKETSGYNPDYAMLRDYEYYRDDVREMLPENMRFMFDIGLDLADMAAAYAMTGGSAGMDLLLANNDAASTIKETLENGGTINEAVDKGVTTMAIQVASQCLKIGTKAGNAFLSPDEFKGVASDFLRNAFGDVVENMPAEIYLKSKERYDELFVGYYKTKFDKNLSTMKREDAERIAIIDAQQQAQKDAIVFGLQNLFSTVVTGVAQRQIDLRVKKSGK